MTSENILKSKTWYHITALMFLAFSMLLMIFWSAKKEKCSLHRTLLLVFNGYFLAPLRHGPLLAIVDRRSSAQLILLQSQQWTKSKSSQFYNFCRIADTKISFFTNLEISFFDLLLGLIFGKHNLLFGKGIENHFWELPISNDSWVYLILWCGCLNGQLILIQMKKRPLLRYGCFFRNLRIIFSTGITSNKYYLQSEPDIATIEVSTNHGKISNRSGFDITSTRICLYWVTSSGSWSKRLWAEVRVWGCSSILSNMSSTRPRPTCM